MKAYVITIFDNDKSVKSADRCIQSGKLFGIDVIKHKAFTPSDSPVKISSEKQIPIDNFEEKYSRFNNCLAAFLSHFALWEKCAESKEPFVILEHDAIFVNSLPSLFQSPIVNLGKPSYGRFNTPQVLGEGPLVSKRYFPGAHGYYIEPAGARQLIEKALRNAGPTDVFINLDNFPNLKEFYPWPVEARDTFTTIQNEVGCQAKHNYGETYEIL